MNDQNVKNTREASRRDHLPYETRHLDDIEWETIRWPGETGKMLFHPRPERPTEPNAGILRLEPGAYHPEHYHGFAQVWYILSGEFTIDGVRHKPGTMIFHPDPHYEGVFSTETGGDIPSFSIRAPQPVKSRSTRAVSIWSTGSLFLRSELISNCHSRSS
jgi:hypothetical protein